MDLLSISRQVFQDEIDALIKTKSLLNSEFEDAVRLIANSHKVIIAGVGKSGIIGKKIAATFSSVGVSSVFLHPVDALHGDIGIVQEGDVAILLSKSGNTEELVKFIPFIKMRNAKIIAIVGNKDSYLSRHADISLDGSVEKEACPFNLAPTSSTTVALAIGDALAVCTMKLRNFTMEEFSKLHPLGQIGRTVTLKVKDVMHTGEKIPRVAIDSDFKTAIIEMSKKPLGCVVVTNDNFDLFGMLTDGDIRRTLSNVDDLRGISVSEIMTKKPVTVGDEAFLVEALALMENRTSQINVLPVVDRANKVIGIIRLHDIVQSTT